MDDVVLKHDPDLQEVVLLLFRCLSMKSVLVNDTFSIIHFELLTEHNKCKDKKGIRRIPVYHYLLEKASQANFR